MKDKEIILKTEGENYPFLQDHFYIKLSSDQTAGELCIVEDTLKPGFYLPRHYHKVMLEVFYILEGEVEFTFEDEVFIAKTGDTITIPPGVWHAAGCEKGGKMITVFKNGSFDKYLKRLRELTDEQFADTAFMKQVAAEFDIYEE